MTQYRPHRLASGYVQPRRPRPLLYSRCLAPTVWALRNGRPSSSPATRPSPTGDRSSPETPSWPRRPWTTCSIAPPSSTSEAIVNGSRKNAAPTPPPSTWRHCHLPDSVPGGRGNAYARGQLACSFSVSGVNFTCAPWGQFLMRVDTSHCLTIFRAPLDILAKRLCANTAHGSLRHNLSRMHYTATPSVIVLRRRF